MNIPEITWPKIRLLDTTFRFAPIASDTFTDFIIDESTNERYNDIFGECVFYGQYIDVYSEGNKRRIFLVYDAVQIDGEEVDQYEYRQRYKILETVFATYKSLQDIYNIKKKKKSEYRILGSQYDIDEIEELVERLNMNESDTDIRLVELYGTPASVMKHVNGVEYATPEKKYDISYDTSEEKTGQQVMELDYVADKWTLSGIVCIPRRGVEEAFRSSLFPIVNLKHNKGVLISSDDYLVRRQRVSAENNKAVSLYYNSATNEWVQAKLAESPDDIYLLFRYLERRIDNITFQAFLQAPIQSAKDEYVPWPSRVGRYTIFPSSYPMDRYNLEFEEVMPTEYVPKTVRVPYTKPLVYAHEFAELLEEHIANDDLNTVLQIVQTKQLDPHGFDEYIIRAAAHYKSLHVLSYFIKMHDVDFFTGRGELFATVAPEVLRIVFKAYNNYTKQLGLETMLPNIDSLTPSQLIQFGLEMQEYIQDMQRQAIVRQFESGNMNITEITQYVVEKYGSKTLATLPQSIIYSMFLGLFND